MIKYNDPCTECALNWDLHTSSMKMACRAKRLAGIAARHAASTQGTWCRSSHVYDNDMPVLQVDPDSPEAHDWTIITGAGELAYTTGPADQSFIANAHQDVPWLLAEVARLNRLAQDQHENLSRVQARSTEQTNEARGFRYFGHDAHNRGLAGIIGAAYAAVCKHGDFLPRLQHIEDGTGGADAVAFRAIAQAECAAAERGEKPLTWRKLVEEEVSEIFAETDPAKLKAEIAQTSAVLAAWSLALDARGAGK